MALTVVTAATARDLTTVSAVKLDLDNTEEKDDKLIAEMIRRASAAIDTYLSPRELRRQTYSETVSGSGDLHLRLSQYPIVSVASVALDGSPVVDYSIEDAAAGILFRRLGWNDTTLVGWNLTGTPLPQGQDPRYVVVYTAGFLIPSVKSDDVNDQGPRLPSDLERACIELVKEWMAPASRKGGGSTITSKKVGDLTITYGDKGQTSELPSQVRMMLDPWRPTW